MTRATRPVGEPGRAGPDSPARAGPPGRARGGEPGAELGRRLSKVLYHCGIDRAARPALKGDRATSPRAALLTGSGRARAAARAGLGPGLARPVPLPRVLPGYPGSVRNRRVAGAPLDRASGSLGLGRVQDLACAAGARQPGQG